MIQLSGEFAPALRSVVIVALLSVTIAFAAGIRLQVQGRAIAPTVMRILTFGWVVIVVAATATPHSFSSLGPSAGDLVLTLGRGGLSDWPVLIHDPTSVAGVLFVSNVLLYIPLGTGATAIRLGSPSRVLAGCLGLSVLIETIQFLFLDRVASTDDVVLNVLGGFIGVSIGAFLLRVRRESSRPNTQGQRERVVPRKAPGDTPGLS